MTKRGISRYALIRRYITDPFGDLHNIGFRKRWLNNNENIKVFLRNVKVIEKRIKDRIVTKIERRKQKYNKKYVKSFFYRVDLIKLMPRKKKKTLHKHRLFIRHKIRKFATQMSVKQLRLYLKKSKTSSQMLKSFFNLIESRIDFVLYKLGFFFTSSYGRQLINHKGFVVNNKDVFLSNYFLKKKDYLSTSENLRPFFFAYLFYRLFFFFIKYYKILKSYSKLKPKKKKYYRKFKHYYNKHNKYFRRKGYKVKVNSLRNKYKIRKRKKQIKILKKSSKIFEKNIFSPFKKIYLYIFKKVRFLRFSGWKNRIYRRFFFFNMWRLINTEKSSRFYFLKSYFGNKTWSRLWTDNKWSRYHFEALAPSFKITSIPFYLEVNFRILTFKFAYAFNYNEVFFPFKINKLKLPSLSYKFK